jgi:hypothetical protein
LRARRIASRISWMMVGSAHHRRLQGEGRSRSAGLEDAAAGDGPPCMPGAAIADPARGR